MQNQHDYFRREENHDPTKADRKLPDPTVCPDCGATYLNGRWSWEEAPAEAARHRCSACERTRTNYPAGHVTVRGRFAREHRDEILRTARNTEAREKAEHPVNRIMHTTEDEDQLVIQTTDLHLAPAIGKALQHAFHGKLRIDYEEDIVRVDWSRDE